MKKVLKCITLILWLILIFYFSNETAGTSLGRSNIIIDLINPSSFNISEDLAIFVVRKLAHIFLYFVLGILIFNVLLEYKFSKKRLAICSIIATLVCAAIDEFHQLFVSGRSGQPRDILIDMIGGLIGVGIYSLVIEMKVSHKFKKYVKFIKIDQLISWAMGLVVAFSFLLATVSLIGTKIIPSEILLVIIPINAIAAVTLTILNIKNKFTPNKKTILLSIISIIVTIIFIYIYSACNNVNSFLGNIQNNGDYNTYSIITKNGNNVELKKNNKLTGIMGDDSNKQIILKTIQDKTTAGTREYESLDAITSALNDKKVDTIVISNSILSLLDENNNTFYKSLRILYSFKIETKKVDTKNTADITKPFIVYISGIDTYGDVSSISRSDVNIIAVINPVTHKILLVNTPRDYYVQLHGTSGLRDKLTHAGIYGIDMSRQTLQDLYGIKIDYYIRVNFTSLLNIVDTIGGVEVYSDYAFRTANYSFAKGYNQLNAKQALEFSRERHAFTEGDRTRGQNQQRVIEAIINKANNPSELFKYQNILKLLGNTIQTNATRDEAAALLNQQISASGKWQTTSISVTGLGKMAPTYSMGSTPLYVMEPDLSSVNIAKGKITEFQK